MTRISNLTILFSFVLSSFALAIPAPNIENRSTTSSPGNAFLEGWKRLAARQVLFERGVGEKINFDNPREEYAFVMGILAGVAIGWFIYWILDGGIIPNNRRASKDGCSCVSWNYPCQRSRIQCIATCCHTTRRSGKSQHHGSGGGGQNYGGNQDNY